MKPCPLIHAAIGPELSSIVQFGFNQGWLSVNPPVFLWKREPKRITREEQLRRNREKMQRLRDARRAQGLNSYGKPFTHPKRNKPTKGK